MMELGDCRFCGGACPWRGNARPTRLSPSVAAGGPPVGPWGRSGPSWPMSVSVTTRGNHPGHPTAAMPLPLRPPPLPLWLLTTWPGGAAWCRAALGHGLVVVWLYERPGLAFPYPLRVHPVRCLPAAWLHSSVATSKPLVSLIALCLCLLRVACSRTRWPALASTASPPWRSSTCSSRKKKAPMPLCSRARSTRQWSTGVR